MKPKILRYDHNKKAILIQTKRHIINDYSQEDSFKVIFQNGSKLVSIVTDLTMKETIGGIKISPFTVAISDFIGNLNYKLYKNDQIIYDSKSSLFMNTLFFSSDGSFLSSLKSYRGNAIILSKEKLYNSDFKSQSYRDYYINMGEINSYSILDFGSSEIVVSEPFKMKLMSPKFELGTSYIDGKQVAIVRNLGLLYFNITSNDLDKLIMMINNKPFKISNLNNGLRTVGKEKYCYVDLNDVIIECNHYVIELFEGNLKLNNRFEFIYDNKISFNQNNGSTGDVQQIYESYFFEKETVLLRKEKLYSNEITSFSKSISIKNKEVLYEFDLNLDHYLINGKKYHFTRFLWLKGLSTPLRLYDNKIMSITLNDGKNDIYKFNLSYRNGDYIQIQSDLLTGLMNDSGKPMYYIVIQYEDSSKSTIKILTQNIMFQRETQIIRDNERYYFYTKFDGLNKMFVSLIENGETVYRNEIESDSLLCLPIEPDIDYSVKLVEGVNNPFQNQVEVLHYEQPFKHFGIEGLLKEKYAVRKAFVNEREKGEHIRGLYLDNLYCEDNQIYGTLYTKKDYKKKVLKWNF